ncbi:MULTISPECIES: MlaD family protein [unclassified Nocardia]|uniref:MlaD family protein n=1 Tax=unclassified Nocardia TaxID=2637762 RepID=UPI0035D55544
MLTRVFSSRAFVSFGLVVVLGLAAAGVYTTLRPHPMMRAYCADMPDAIGLFEGSDVTVMGVRLGRVTKVANNGATARVSFEIPASRKLPDDVGATTLADSLVANRRLALIGAEPTGAGRNPNTCITRTVTPKSLSETFTALSRLADELNGTPDPGQTGAVGQGLTALNSLTAHTGPQLNAILTRLGTALHSPDAAIGHIGDLIDAVGSLARDAATYWPEIRDMLTRLTGTFDDVSNIAVPPVVAILDKLVDVLPALNDLTVTLGGPLLHRLDSVENLPQLIRSGVEGLHGVLALAPAVSSAFAAVIDPATGAISMAYAPPRVAIPQPDAAAVCAAIDAVTPGTCTSTTDGMVNVSLAQVIMGQLGAR